MDIIHDLTHSYISVEAGPGSGKTRLLVERAKYLHSCGLSFLVLSFTRSVVQEIRHRFLEVGLSANHVSTFHSCAASVLKSSLRIDAKLFENFFSGSENSYARDQISRWRSSGYSLARMEAKLLLLNFDLEEDRNFQKQYEKLIHQWRAYEDFCFEKNTWDFTHQLQKSLPLISKPLYSHVLVDEKQDMSVLEWSLVQKLASNIFLVGDENQSIFSFQTGEPVNYSGYDFHVYQMIENWRCRLAVCDVANTLLNQSRFRQMIFTSSVHSDSGMVSSRIFQDSVDEFKEISREIRNIASNITIGDGNIIRKITIGVLFRSKYWRKKWQTEFGNCPENISFLTIHTAKGTQYDYVYIPVCMESEYPHYLSEDIEEERRVFYVAVTRARFQVHFSHAKFYADIPSQPSRFLKDLPLEIFDFSVVLPSPFVDSSPFELLPVSHWITAREFAHRFSFSSQYARKILQNQFSNPDVPVFRGKVLSVRKQAGTGHYLVDATTLPQCGIVNSPQVVQVDPSVVQKYPFCDWMTLYQFSQDHIKVINAGKVVKYDSDGAIEYTAREGIPCVQSHDTSVYLKAAMLDLFHRLVASGNFGRLTRPDNVWNFSYSETLQRVSAVLTAFGLPAVRVSNVVFSQVEKSRVFTRLEVSAGKHDRYVSAFSKNPNISCRVIKKRFGQVEVITVHTISDGARLTRIDLTKNFSVGSEENLNALIYTLNSLNPTRMKKRSYGPDIIFPQSVVWGVGSSLYQIEAYDKGAEILARAKTDYQRDLGHYCRSHGMIRVELKLRGLLRVRGLDYLAFVDEERLSNLYNEKTAFLGDTFSLDAIYSDLTKAVQSKRCGIATLKMYLLWKSGADLKTFNQPRTLRTHQKLIRDISGVQAFSLYEMPLDSSHLKKSFSVEIRPVAAPPEYVANMGNLDSFKSALLVA